MTRIQTALTVGASLALFATPALADDAKPAAPAAEAAPASAPAKSAAGDAQVRTGGSAALLLGYGFDDVFKLGLGVRGGYTLPMKVYVGGTFVYHLGTSVDVGAGQSVSVNIMMFGAEGGYELAAGPVIVRPYAGLGLAVVKVSEPAITVAGVTAGGGSASDSRVYFAPGVTVLYPVTSNIAVGADARVVIVSSDTALDLMLTGQYHF